MSQGALTEERTIPRPSIESLSNLIFGLALSIGAIVLLGKQASSFTDVVSAISVFGFGFFILLNVWYRYSMIMKVLPIETSSLVTVNLLLLFLVAVEPYLLNLITLGSLQDVAVFDPVSQLYAIDLGSMYVILSFFFRQAVVQERQLHRMKFLGRFRREGIFLLVVGLVFYVSVLPFFASIEITGVLTAREILWLVFIPVGFILRFARTLETRSAKKVVA